MEKERKKEKRKKERKEGRKKERKKEMFCIHSLVIWHAICIFYEKPCIFTCGLSLTHFST
jgi:hypothetical protein